MAKKSIIDPAFLRKLVRYEPETGLLFWLPRTPDMFTSGRFGAIRKCKIWNTRFAGREAFAAVRPDGYRAGVAFGCKLLSHRVAWAVVHGEWPDGEIDHINHDPTDNRLANLRAVSASLNQRNKRIPRSNKSGAVGVRFYKATNRWVAFMRIGNKSHHLGYFKDFDEAVRARKDAEAGMGFHANHGERW